MQQLWFIIISYLYMCRASTCSSSGVYTTCTAEDGHVERTHNDKPQLLHQYVWHVLDRRNTYRVLVTKPEGKRWEDNIKMDL
jgi:hypothetical protein